MDIAIIKKMFSEAALAKVAKSDSNGTKATWSMDDQVAVAVKALCECVKDEVEPTAVEAVIRATYNHSAMAQKFAALFEGTGHFARASKVQRHDDWEADLRKQAAAMLAKPAA